MGQRSNLNIGEPEPHSLEALLHCNIIHHHHTICLAKELLGYAAVPVSVAGFECQHSGPFFKCEYKNTLCTSTSILLQYYTTWLLFYSYYSRKEEEVLEIRHIFFVILFLFTSTEDLKHSRSP